MLRQGYLLQFSDLTSCTVRYHHVQAKYPHLLIFYFGFYSYDRYYLLALLQFIASVALGLVKVAVALVSVPV